MTNPQYIEKFNELYAKNVGYGLKYKNDKDLCDSNSIPTSTFASYKHVLDRRDPPPKLLNSLSVAFNLRPDYLYLYWLYTEKLSEHNPDQPVKESTTGFVEMVNTSKIIVNPTEYSHKELLGYLCKKDFLFLSLQKDDILICKKNNDILDLSNNQIVLFIAGGSYGIGRILWLGENNKLNLYVTTEDEPVQIKEDRNDLIYKAIHLDRVIR